MSYNAYVIDITVDIFTMKFVMKIIFSNITWHFVNYFHLLSVKKKMGLFSELDECWQENQFSSFMI